jgi:hypothetical protein
MTRRACRPQPTPVAPRAVPVDLVQAVVKAIARGELDSELAVLGTVIHKRVRLLASARSMIALASLRVGDRGADQPQRQAQLPARSDRGR